MRITIERFPSTAIMPAAAHGKTWQVEVQRPPQPSLVVYFDGLREIADFLKELKPDA
jgi:hypothetical protein